MAKKAKIIKVPERYAIIIDGEIVDWARSGYQAAEKASHYGATEMENGEWTKEIGVITSTRRSRS